MDELEGLLSEQETRLTSLPLASQQIRDFISDLARDVDFATASVEERGEVIDMLEVLRSIESAAKARRHVIEEGIIAAATKLDARELRIADGSVRITSRSSYDTHDGAMHDALVALIPRGDVTKDEVEQAIATVITYKPDHRRLNALLKRGGRVQEAIESNREKQVSNPTVKVNRKGGAK